MAPTEQSSVDHAITDAMTEAALDAFWPAIPTGARHANGDLYLRYMRYALGAAMEFAVPKVSVARLRADLRKAERDRDHFRDLWCKAEGQIEDVRNG